MDTEPVCRITHRQLLSGTCPWCDEIIIEGHERTTSNTTARVVDRVWNIDVLKSDLGAPDDEIRMSTVSNVMSHSPPLNQSIPLLALALNDNDERIRVIAGHALSHLGRDISHEQAVELENQLETSSHELALRLVLVAYHFSGQRKSRAAGHARRKHILWLIENAAEIEATGKPDFWLMKSEDPEGYQQGKSLWLTNIEANPQSASILANAASFFALNDSKLSEQLLHNGAALQPDNPYWWEQLGQLYARRSRQNDEEAGILAKKSFAALEQAEECRGGQESLEMVESILYRIHALAELAKSAFEASEFEKAANYASELLTLSSSNDLPEFFRDDGNAVHYGNLVLGRVALERGNIEEAKLYLLASGRTQGSPNLMSFGPNMSLARDLLKRGEREVVLEYFAMCAEFWEHGSASLKTWANQITAGDIPEFGANLKY